MSSRERLLSNDLIMAKIGPNENLVKGLILVRLGQVERLLMTQCWPKLAQKIWSKA